MPIYTYQIVHDDGTDGPVFECVHAMSDPPLTRHPDTGQQCKRVYQPIHIAGTHGERRVKQLTSDKNLARNGFTKYQKNGKGNYERVVGSAGPERLTPGE